MAASIEMLLHERKFRARKEACLREQCRAYVWVCTALSMKQVETKIVLLSLWLNDRDLVNIRNIQTECHALTSVDNELAHSVACALKIRIC
jgi:hypothetical protein